VSGKVYFVTLKRIGMTTEDCFYFNSSGNFSDLFGYLGTWKQLNLGILAVWKFEASDGGTGELNMHGFQFLNRIWGSGHYDGDSSFHLTARGKLDNYEECPH
jgi:hypothetical protein